MFCPRCGRNLNGDEYACPECGNMLREAPSPVGTQSQGPVIWVFFLIGFAIMFSLSFFVGVYMFCLFIPIFVTGTRNGRGTMFFLGAMVGAAAGMLGRFLF